MQMVAQIPDFTVHYLRRNFASLLVLGGTSLHMISRPLGRSQIGTNRRSVRVTDLLLSAGIYASSEVVNPRLRVVRVGAC